jgi:hypothetical protein
VKGPNEPMCLESATPPCVFAVFADPAPEREEEFHHWYDHIHGPDALENGSFHALHRFRAVGSGERCAPFLALWEGSFGSEAEAWEYINPRARALQAAGRVSDVASVRFAAMLLRVATFDGVDVEPVRGLVTVQNDWRQAATAEPAPEWWSASGLEAAPGDTRWLLSSDPAGRGAGFHLAVFPSGDPPDDRPIWWERFGEAGTSPVPPHQPIFLEHDETGAPGAAADAREPAPAWVMTWEPISSLRV